MLYSPWREEQADLVQRNCKEFCQGNEEAKKANFDRFNLKRVWKTRLEGPWM